MSEEKTEETPAEDSAPTLPSRGRSLRQQMLGAVIGGVIALMLLRIGNQIGWWLSINETTWILVGAVVGSMASSFDYYDRAGAHLTGRQSKGNKKTAALNIFVALLGMVVIAALIFGLSSLVGVLFFPK
ncbi:MAG: hypothetical protein JXA21_19595 [Anaerolineae bacterium]|nr:hypothetical protein [Anaerolineae bacterium]